MPTAATHEGAGRAAAAMAAVGIAVLIASYAVNAMDRVLFPLLVSDVRGEYRFDLPEAGLLSTVFTLGMALAGVPTGLMMARLSRRAVAQIGTVIFSVGTIVTVAAVGFADMLVYRAVTGVGEAMQLTALLAMFSGYFSRHRAAGIGSLNYAYAVGAIVGPALGGRLLVQFGSWRAPMIAFGGLGLGVTALVFVLVRPQLSECDAGAPGEPRGGGAATLLNPDTVVLALLSVLFGLGLYGYLGMYPTFLREQLHFAPADAGTVMSAYGLGVLVSLGAGWLGDRFPARAVLSLSFLAAAGVCALLFNGPTSFLAQTGFSFVLGALFSGTVFVNLAGYHVKAVTAALAGSASGIFVTTLFGSATVAGYAIGALARGLGWTTAANLQLVLMCVVAAAVSLLLGTAPPRVKAAAAGDDAP